jgi:hypothetical protein
MEYRLMARIGYTQFGQRLVSRWVPPVLSEDEKTIDAQALIALSIDGAAEVPIYTDDAETVEEAKKAVGHDTAETNSGLWVLAFAKGEDAPTLLFSTDWGATWA